MNELPEGWTVEPFSQVASYTTGRTPARANPAYWAKGERQVPWVAISDMEQYGIITETAESVSELAFENVFRERIVPAGTLIMSFKLTIGRVATLDIPACHNEAIISIYPREGVDQRYLGYFLSQVDYTDHQDRQIKGNTLNQSKIDQIQVLLPPSKEQVRIADVLDKCRLGINTERAAEKTAEELKRACMHELFTRGLRGEAQKETEIGPVPENWHVGSLEDLAQFQRGFDITKSVQIDGDIPVVSSGGIKSYHNQAAASGPGLLIGRKGSIGQLHYVDTDYWPHDTTLWCTDFKGNVPKFVFYRLQTVDMKKLDSGAANPALNRNFLHAEVVSWPDPAEQQDIVTILDAIGYKIGLHQRKRAVLEELFKSLLRKLMTGEIAVSDLDLSALSPASTQHAGVTA